MWLDGLRPILTVRGRDREHAKHLGTYDAEEDTSDPTHPGRVFLLDCREKAAAYMGELVAGRDRCSCDGHPPEVPRKGDTGGDDNLECLGGWHETPAPEPSPDGTRSSTGPRGVYRYGVRDHTKVKYGSPMLPCVAELCGKGRGA